MNHWQTTPSHPRIIRAAGGLVRRPRSDGEVELLLVHRPKYDDWSMPKGKLKSKESWKMAAIREIVEETSIAPIADGFAGTMQYPIAMSTKLVFYWFMSIGQQGTFVPNEEVDAIRWVDQTSFTETMTYSGEVRFIQQIQLFSRNG